MNNFTGKYTKLKAKGLLLVLGITILAFAVRIYRVTESPEGLYIDEASIGYNAYSLTTTGRDEHGIPFPLYFEAFGEYKLPVYIYLVAVTQLVLGVHDFAIRLPAIVFGALSIPALYFLLTNMFPGNKHLALWASFLLAISPWHFQFTHTGFEASVALFFLILGSGFFFRSTQTSSTWLLLLSTVGFVIALYTYTSARIVVPVVCIALLGLYHSFFSRYKWIAATIVAAVLSYPFWMFAISPAGMARAYQVSIFYQPYIQNPIPLLIQNYLANISPVTLFVHGEPTIAHLTVHRMSLLHLAEAPFFLTGVLYALIKRTKTLSFLLILACAGFLPPALTTLSPHALRAFLVLPATISFSSLGIDWILSKIQHRPRMAIAATLITTLILSAYQFLTTYHGSYLADAGWDWQVGIKRVVQRLRTLHPTLDPVFIEEPGPAKISFLYYLRIDPKDYQQSVDKNVFGQYHFGACDQGSATWHSVCVTQQIFSNMVPPQIIYYPNGIPAYYLYAR